MVQSNKFHKSYAVGVMSEVGLTTDQDLAELMLKKYIVFYTSVIPEVVWYESLYNTNEINIEIKDTFIFLSSVLRKEKKNNLRPITLLQNENIFKAILLELFYCNGNIFLKGTFMVVTVGRK